MLKPFLVGLLSSSAMAAAWPAAASAQQFGRATTTYTYYDYGQSQLGRNHRRHSSGSDVYGDRFYNSYPSSVRQNGHFTYFDRSERIDGFRHPSPVIIIQQAPVYAYPASTCSTSVVGSPIPLPYARDTRTGLPCS